jgi:hypothetical protein
VYPRLLLLLLLVLLSLFASFFAEGFVLASAGFSVVEAAG